MISSENIPLVPNTGATSRNDNKSIAENYLPFAIAIAIGSLFSIRWYLLKKIEK